MSWRIGVLKNTVRVSPACSAAIAVAGGKYGFDQEYMVEDDGSLSFGSDEHSDFLKHDDIRSLVTADGAAGEVLLADVEGVRGGGFWGYRFEGGACQKLRGEVVWSVDTRDEEIAALRALLWGGVADQTWCICLGDEAGVHLQVIDGWTKYRGLDENQALDVAADKLHAVGFRAGMTVDEACALFKAAREGK